MLLLGVIAFLFSDNERICMDIKVLWGGNKNRI